MFQWNVQTDPPIVSEDELEELSVDVLDKLLDSSMVITFGSESAGRTC